MDTTESLTSAQGRGSAWFWVLAALAVGLVAVSAQSFWIDEACTAWKATQTTLRLWWQVNRADRGSDLQMPLYMLFAWGWAQVFGTSEIALRGANLPWFWLGLVAVWRGFKDAGRLRVGILVAVLTSPFAWAYLNEARPYAMQIGMSLTVLAALWRLAAVRDPGAERRWAWILCAGALALAGSSLLAMVFCGAILGAAILAAGSARVWKLAQAQWPCWSTMLVGCLGLGIFYLWTLQVGAGAANGSGTDGRNALLAAYELLGFSGLGPGRIQIRTDGIAAFRPYLAWLCVYAVIVGVELAVTWRLVFGLVSRRTTLFWLLAIGAAALFVFGVGLQTRFRVLGRHFAPLLPLVCLVFGAGLVAMAERSGWRRWVAGAFVVITLTSCAQMRFAQRHAKDAYREAAARGRAALARDESVWWSAELHGAQLYQLPTTRNAAERGKAWFVVNPAKNFATDLRPPDLVLLSKPDLYDASGALTEYLAGGGYLKETSLSGFTVWRKPNKGVALESGDAPKVSGK